MPGAFSGLGMLGQTLRYFQRGLDVTGHNIANINTDGYSRQNIGYGTTDPEAYYGIGGQYWVGTGVGISQISRSRDIFLERQFRDRNSEQGRLGTMLTSLKQIQGVFPEPTGSGISEAITKFFDGWSSLSSNPSDPAAKLQIRMAAETLASRIRSTYGELSAQVQNLDAQLSAQFDAVDDLTSRIALLNQKIVSAQAGGGEANDLLDQRDLAIQELSTLVPVQTHVNEDGTIRVYSGEIGLVDGVSARQIPRNYDIATGTLSNGTQTFSVTGGSIGGTLQSGQAGQNVLTKLDQLANELKTAINTLHQTGVNSTNTTNIAFFDPASTGAANFDLSTEIKADLANIMSGTSGNAGDGGLALALSQMRDTKFAALNNQTFKSFYGEVLSTVGRDVSGFEIALDTSSAVMTQIESQRQSVSGVNLDEEMTNLLKYQRSYQAASHALSVFSQVTEDLINLVR